jgi:ferredoxin, 2Fe-2S
MTRITFIEHDGRTHCVEATVGQSVMQAAVDNMIPGITADCGGSCSCATCHAYIGRPWSDLLSPPAQMELDVLEAAADRQATSRLTCQIKVTPQLDGLEVNLPASTA